MKAASLDAALALFNAQRRIHLEAIASNISDLAIDELLPEERVIVELLAREREGACGMNTFGFEWTFSSRVLERNCSECRAKTSGYLTNVRGIRKPLCSSCFFRMLKGAQPMKKAIYRQGDVLIRLIPSLPKQKAQPRLTGILAYGEVTGHAHRIEDAQKAEVLEIGTGLYLRVGEEGVRVVHEEHAPVSLPPGNYEVEIQREYTPAEIRNVAD
jgi:hypothetical protein